MNNAGEDLDLWVASYSYLGAKAQESEISNCSTDNLLRAHELLEQCKERPPGYQFNFLLSEVWPKISDGSFDSWCENLILAESLRYPRVCRELGARHEASDPEAALSFLRAAFLPEWPSLPLQSRETAADGFEEHMTWMNNLADKAAAKVPEVVALTKQIEKDGLLSQDVALEWISAAFQLMLYPGFLQASKAIGDVRAAWNLSINAMMWRIEMPRGNDEAAGKARSDCVELLKCDDGLFEEVLNAWLRTAGAAQVQVFVDVPQSPLVATIELTLTSAIDAKFQSLMDKVDQNLHISNAVHDRLDFIVETLIDLNQRSEMTWEEVKKVAQGEPDYKATRAAIEDSTRDRLEKLWTHLKPASKKDLTDAEYVYEQCRKTGGGWRMAVLGYCTTAERELKVAYRSMIATAFAVGGAPPRAGSLGDLIQGLENIGERLSKAKQLPELAPLLARLQDLRRLNLIRNRAAHADHDVTEEEVVWAREQLTSDRSDRLIFLIVAPRSK